MFEMCNVDIGNIHGIDFRFQPEGYTNFFTYLNKASQFLVIDIAFAVHYLINNIDIQNIFDIDLIRIDPDAFPEFLPDQLGISNDHQYSETPLFVLDH